MPITYMLLMREVPDTAPNTFRARRKITDNLQNKVDCNSIQLLTPSIAPYQQSSIKIKWNLIPLFTRGLEEG